MKKERSDGDSNEHARSEVDQLPARRRPPRADAGGNYAPKKMGNGEYTMDNDCRDLFGVLMMEMSRVFL